MAKENESALDFWDIVLLWIAIVLWLIVFIAGTVVNSEPFRNRFAAFTGGFAGSVRSGMMVMLTYTFTNVAFLCVLASILGMLGSKAVLGSDPPNRSGGVDTSSPRNSAVLRGFFIYLLLVAGVLVFSEDPASPTQSEYVRLAGLISLLAFVVNYQPLICEKLLDTMASWASGSSRVKSGGDGSQGNPALSTAGSRGSGGAPDGSRA